LEAIGQANRTLLLLINNAVDNTKLELGKWMEVTEPVRLRDLLADVVSALKPFGDNKAIRTELTGDGDFLLEADRRVLRAAIIDLALGSIKLSRNGGIVTIDLSIADMVRITIKDCGKPVPPEYWGRFFDREMEPYPPLKGSRQGLCVARDFLTQMGWSVAFGHAPDGGNTFTLSRPAGKEGLDEQGANK
jgi:signal transduction histidine kinase